MDATGDDDWDSSEPEWDDTDDTDESFEIADTSDEEDGEWVVISETQEEEMK